MFVIVITDNPLSKGRVCKHNTMGCHILLTFRWFYIERSFLTDSGGHLNEYYKIGVDV